MSGPAAVRPVTRRRGGCGAIRGSSRWLVAVARRGGWWLVAVTAAVRSVARGWWLVAVARRGGWWLVAVAAAVRSVARGWWFVALRRGLSRWLVARRRGSSFSMPVCIGSLTSFAH